MKQYIVTFKQIVEREYLVEAESGREAEERVFDCNFYCEGELLRKMRLLKQPAPHLTTKAKLLGKSDAPGALKMKLSPAERLLQTYGEAYGDKNNV